MQINYCINGRLLDIDNACFLSLDELEEIIKSGKQIQITDKRTNKDISFEEMKKDREERFHSTSVDRVPRRKKSQSYDSNSFFKDIEEAGDALIKNGGLVNLGAAIIKGIFG